MPEYDLELHQPRKLRRQQQETGTGIETRWRPAGFFGSLIEASSEITAPEAWPRHIRGTRAYVMASYPFSVIYRVHSKRIEILAVSHHRRRPGYWSERRSI